VKQNPAATIGYAFKEVGYWIEIVLKSVGMMFTGQVSINDLSGPVGVVDSVNTVVEQSKPEGTWMVCLNLFNYIVMLSANLGVMNLLPLPALDGGKLLFLVIEALRGKPVKAEHEGMVHFIGMVLLMFLMVYIMFKDIAGLF
jgi:regulator of sigma E protease